MSLEALILACDELVDLHASFKGKSARELKKSAFEAYRVELQALWLDVKKAYSEYISAAAADDVLIASLPEVKAKYRNSSDTYIEFLSDILEATRPQEVSLKSNNEKSDNVELKHHMHLPPCETEIFSGNFLKWPAFRDMFTALYIRHARLSPVQKLFHLRARTKDHALSIVSKFEITDDNFEAAWAALKEHYENKRVLVNNHLSILLGQVRITVESADALKELQSNINEAIIALESYGIEVKKWDALVTYVCASRLPPQTLSLWEESLANPKEIQSWEKMNIFITNRYRVLDNVSDMNKEDKVLKNSGSKQQSSSSFPRVRTHHAQVSSQCKVCKGTHALRVCPDFLKMSVSQRRNTIRKLKYCYNCLAFSHLVTACQSESTCFHCKGKHHSLLHFDKSPSGSFTPQIQSTHSTSAASQNAQQHTVPRDSSNIRLSNTEESPNVSANAFFAKTKRTTLLATAMIRIHHHHTDFEWRALIDPGSEISFISEEVQRKLKLPVQSVMATVAGVNSSVTATSNKMCSFTLRSKFDKQFSLSARALVLKTVSDSLPSISIDIGNTQNLFDFPLADPCFNQSGKIDLLIGADLYPLIIRDGLKFNVFQRIMAQNTVFGWVLLGPLEPPISQNNIEYTRSLSFFNEVTVDEEIQRFWKLEELPQILFLTAAEQFCENLFEKTTYRDKTGRFVVRLPFKDDSFQSPGLGNSYEIAKRQFLRNEKRLLYSPILKNEYDSVLSEYIDLGHMKPSDSADKVCENGTSYVMPHHAVIKPESLTTKVRVVFNASCSSSNGKSLNDLLYPGPALQTDITLLMLNWRLYKYVFNSDVEKMYRQIKIYPDQTPFQKILFRQNPKDDLSVFEMLTLTFGVSCSPYLAIRSLHQLAKEVNRSHPLASKILLNELFVDDVLSGAHDISTAVEAQFELIEVLKSAGFNLRKWTSNAKELLSPLPKGSLLNEDFLTIDDKSSVKMLGIKWKATLDTFSFSVQSIPQSNSFSKRSVLSVIAKLYDPIGWLAPIVITAKILMQQIWKDKTEWDSCLLPTTEQSWKVFVASLPEVANVSIPRWVEYTPHAVSQIHGFCDASEKAYAACIYLRVQQQDKITSHLLWAKSKVAPVNTISLPRLELQGAVLLSKMISLLSTALQIQNVSLVKLWTDSTIVLAWLQKQPCSWQTFVANRTAEILKNTAVTDWSHVVSGENPADLATRGVSPVDLRESSLWWNGPHWLLKPQSIWPQTKLEPVDESNLEVKKVKSFKQQVVQDFEEDLAKFSNWPKAVCVFAYMERFHHSFKRHGGTKYSSPELSYEEFNLAKQTLIVFTQQKYFKKEYGDLIQGKHLESKSWLGKFNPFIDDKGVMRANGRLALSTLSYNEKFPILLPVKCLFVQLYIQYIHELSLHGEIQIMMRMIRSEYWIPQVKNLVKKCIIKCTVCTRYKKHVQTQLMGALPKERTVLGRPFTNTGVDFAGPFLIKTYYGRKCRLDKGYVCIFVCFATRAIHLELVSELTTQAFLASFTRFISRRGTPEQMFSDHGTNFVGASKVLLSNFHKSLLHCPSAVAHKLKWNFIPPGSPHMGGLWEAGVKSFKGHFRKVAGNEKFTFEEFTTLLTRIECTLNSRPLSPMSEDVSDIVPLTPGHFLTGGVLNGLPEPSYSDQSLSIINRWRKLQILHHQLSARWKEEYLKELHKRYKWKYPERNVQIDDLVIIRNENLPPNEWRLGRVINVHAGHDNKIRVAEIRTEKGIITRSIAKICILLPQK
ncbi:uncharacterized protein LOC129909721 [Episyrphus balteatus]|uniref:uncharacterized protein LOC129909721 n=1 Tax=Episyrphus balteatus TaxID=286459 RepID=UPI0024855C9D|nr:uncharacterized protein LOC129909721 [Episyrphus balteatus]